MDGRRFDAWTKQLATRGISRRRVLRGLGGTLAGLTAAGLAGRHETDAFVCRNAGVLCGKDAHCCSGRCDSETHRCLCPAETPDLCGRDCVDPATDVTNCGECGSVCPEKTNATAGCSDSTCTYTCNDGYKACGDACIPEAWCCTSDDCNDQNPCTIDRCDPTSHSCSSTNVDDNIGCGDGLACCGGTCTDITSSPNCGTCGTTCTDPVVCYQEHCCAPATCQSGQCGEFPDNCGGTITCGTCDTCSGIGCGSKDETGTYLGICANGECFEAAPHDVSLACSRCGEIDISARFTEADSGVDVCVNTYNGIHLCGGDTCTHSSDCPAGQWCGNISCEKGHWLCFPGCIQS